MPMLRSLRRVPNAPSRDTKDPIRAAVDLNPNPAAIPVSDRQREIDHLDHDIDAVSNALERFQSLAAVLAGALVTIGVLQRHTAVEVLAPYGFTVIVCYILQLYTDAEMLTTLRDYLELSVNRQEGRPAAMRPAVLDSTHRNRRSVHLVGLFFLLAIGGTIILSAVEGFRERVRLHALVGFGNLFGQACCVLIIWSAGLELRHAQRDALHAISEVQSH